ncbi:unnamed protein product [Peniophora sp. CBMAI 1063]|nr:unnamed protein product [Peniophora sp. CBMAI 1063]
MGDSYDELEAFFDEPARAEIWRPFKSIERYAYYICKKSIRVGVQALHRIKRLVCVRDADSIFEDLEKDPASTPERRSAALLLHCYHLHPVSGPNDTRENVFNPTLLIHPSPSRQLVHDDHGWPDTHGSNITHYYVVEHNAETGSTHTPSRSVPRLGQCRDGATTLWRIPGRSPGLFFGYADSNVILDPGDCELYGVFERLRAHMKHFREGGRYRRTASIKNLRGDAYGVMLLNDLRLRVYW